MVLVLPVAPLTSPMATPEKKLPHLEKNSTLHSTQARLRQLCHSFRGPYIYVPTHLFRLSSPRSPFGSWSAFNDCSWQSLVISAILSDLKISSLGLCGSYSRAARVASLGMLPIADLN